MQKCPDPESFPRNYSHWCSNVRVEKMKISEGMIIGQGRMWIYRVDPNSYVHRTTLYSILVLVREFYLDFNFAEQHSWYTSLPVLFGNHIE